MGLIARYLELRSIRTTLTSWHGKSVRSILPPRATLTRLKRGSTIGNPHDTDQQKRILLQTLQLLEQDAPLPPIILDER